MKPQRLHRSRHLRIFLHWVSCSVQVPLLAVEKKSRHPWQGARLAGLADQSGKKVSESCESVEDEAKVFVLVYIEESETILARAENHPSHYWNGRVDEYALLYGHLQEKTFLMKKSAS